MGYQDLALRIFLQKRCKTRIFMPLSQKSIINHVKSSARTEIFIRVLHSYCCHDPELLLLYMYMHLHLFPADCCYSFFILHFSPHYKYLLGFLVSKQLSNMDKLMLFLPILIMNVLHLSFATSDSPPLAPALYVFGDSLFDSGNNNLLPTLARANFPPYGMNFVKGATGRFTNGKTVADFIAEFLGLPYSPPYVRILQRVFQSDELTGVNFASGSCGILPKTGSDLGICLNFPQQIHLFERLVQDNLHRRFRNTQDLSTYLSKSIFLISVGNNDYINNYINTQNYDTSKRYSPLSFARLLVDNLSLQLQRLYKVGARKVIVFEIGPIGCIPSTIKQFKHDGQCAEGINELAIFFNNELAPMLQNLTSTLQDSNFILGHGHWIGYDAVINPSNYGLIDTSSACCVTWMNGTSGCIPEFQASACKSPEKHYFWDGFHLTETMYREIATLCFNGSSVCIPKNIQELVLQA